MMDNQRLTSDEAKRLGASIRAARDNQRVSREELGRRIKLSVSRIVQYEKGMHRANGKVVLDVPPAPMLALIAEALDTTPEQIMVTAGLEGVDTPVIAPITPGEDKAIQAIRSEADRADIIDLRISAAKDAWQEFVESLSPDAKGRLLTLLVTGNLNNGNT